MRKILILAGTLCLLFSLRGVAQNLADVGHIKQLVTKHAAALGLSQEDLANYRVATAYFDESTGLTMAYLQQTHKGVDVYNAIMSVAFKNENLGTYQSSWTALPDSKTSKLNPKPSITALTALKNALSNLNLPVSKAFFVALSQTPDGQEFEFDNLGVALDNIGVRLMWVPESEYSKNLVLSWQVSFISLKGNNSWVVKVNAANGTILRKDNLTVKENFGKQEFKKIPRNVYVYQDEPADNKTAVDEVKNVTDVQAVTSAKYLVIKYPALDADHGVPTLHNNPWTLNGVPQAYTKKWNSDQQKDYDSLKGNNVFVYSDANSNNQPDFTPRSTTPLPNLTWNYVPDFTVNPLEDIPTESFGLTNLFYWNNLMHDMSYDYGFDEPAGNMQTSNLGRGGKQNDFVLSEDYDTGDTLNANFALAADGKKPRQQLFFAYPSPLKILKINSPNSFKGFKITRESNVSRNNKLAQTGAITQNVVLYKDQGNIDSSNACAPAANPGPLTGKIAYIDRGSCSFVVKFQNAQQAGAVGIIVGNVAEDDPRYSDGSTGNVIVIMSANPLVNSITIPGVFIGYDTAQKLKNFLLNSTTVNATMQPTPNIDAALDNTIAPHEYTHGVSTRLVGGPNTVSCLSNGEQMGEGWSDYFALMMTTNWATAKKTDGPIPRPIGNYLFGLDSTYTGIRVYPYSKDFSIDPWTYDSLQQDPDIKEYSQDPSVIYYTGEVWCSTMWDLTWDLIKTENLINKTFLKPAVAGGNTTAMKLAIQAMKLVKCSPGCLDMRDAVLKADTVLYSALHSDQIWKTFARRGMGYSAVQGSNNKIKDGHGAYDLPPGVFLKEDNTGVVAEQATRNVAPSITVGPNPTKDFIHVKISANKEKLSVQLMNNNGSVIGSYIVTGDNLDINVSTLASGVYNLVISGGSYNSTYKVVVQ